MNRMKRFLRFCVFLLSIPIISATAAVPVMPEDIKHLTNKIGETVNLVMAADKLDSVGIEYARLVEVSGSSKVFYCDYNNALNIAYLDDTETPETETIVDVDGVCISNTEQWDIVTSDNGDRKVRIDQDGKVCYLKFSKTGNKSNVSGFDCAE